jgi:hypothetical protein
MSCHLQIDADLVPDPAYHFDADPDADPDPNFYLMWMRIWMRIKVTKMMRILADTDPQHWIQGPKSNGSRIRNAGYETKMFTYLVTKLYVNNEIIRFDGFR